MPVATSLRLEGPDGRIVEEYRIQENDIEMRSPQSWQEDEFEWHSVSASELTEHVKCKTVVAQWLERRLGWRRLLRACVTGQNPFGDIQNTPELGYLHHGNGENRRAA